MGDEKDNFRKLFADLYPDGIINNLIDEIVQHYIIKKETDDSIEDQAFSIKPVEDNKKD